MPVPNTDTTQLIPRISVSLWKTVQKKPKELQVQLKTKKIFHQKRELFRKNVFRTHKGQHNGQYDSPSETETDKSNIQSEKKQSNKT
jgi:hypothetical protein